MAHLWNGEDTFCRKYSTGSLRLKRGYRVTESPEGRSTCVMCDSVRQGLDMEERFNLALAKEGT